MLVRLIIYIILIAVLYRAVKLWFGRSENGRGPARVKPQGQVDDVMIKDPVCGAYFPQRKAVTLNGQNKALFFCSTQCRDRYLEGKS